MAVELPYLYRSKGTWWMVNGGFQPTPIDECMPGGGDYQHLLLDADGVI